MNNTRNKFNDWLKDASYDDILKMYQSYKLKLMEYRFTISKVHSLYHKGTKMENISMVKYKFNLLSNKLNLMTLKVK